MKKFVVILALVLAFAAPVMAAGELLVDDADVLISQEERQLTQKLEYASDACDMDVAVVIVDGIGNEDIQDYADDYYDYNGYADDGVMLVVDMDSRQWWITGTGEGADIFTSSVINKIGNKIEDDLADGEYLDAFETYAKLCVEYVEKDGSFNVGGSLLVALIIGLLAALIVTGIWRGQLKSVRFKSAAADYVKPGSLSVQLCQDLYLYSTVSKVKRQQSSSGSHTSSSGRSHSGGGGRF